MGSKVIVGIIVVLVVLAAIFYFYQQPSDGNGTPEKTFSDYYSEFSASWEDAGFDVEFFHSDFESLTELSEETLNEIKDSLASYKAASDNAAVKALADIYSKQIDLALNVKRIDSFQEEIDALEEPCDAVPLLKFQKSFLEDSRSVSLEIAGLIYDFTSNFSDEAEEVNLNNIEVPSTTEEVALLEVLIENLESTCEVTE